ncbi:kinase-like protein [Stipitochalara longipes BDJ]|nr:kinase-like protein [Stipitochalara longipes BDJ]
MSFLTELDHFKLETIFRTDHVVHTEYISNVARGYRKRRIETKWYKERQLGEGGFGAVFLETKGTDRRTERAVKKIDKRWMRATSTDYTRELKALAEFSKPKYRAEGSFVEFFGWYESPDSVFLAMEYLPLGDLATCVPATIEENEVKQITAQIFRGLEIMHAEGFAHRDLKPQNILVAQKSPNWWVKLADFGLSKKIQAGLTALRTSAGTQSYQAPEFFHFLETSEEDDDEYTNSVDIWSVGCIVCRLLTGEVPFPTPRSLRQYCKYSDKLDQPTVIKGLNNGRVSSDCIKFVNALLKSDPAKRPTPRDALDDQWLTSVIYIQDEAEDSPVSEASERSNDKPSISNLVETPPLTTIPHEERLMTNRQLESTSQEPIGLDASDNPAMLEAMVEPPSQNTQEPSDNLAPEKSSLREPSSALLENSSKEDIDHRIIVEAPRELTRISTMGNDSVSNAVDATEPHASVASHGAAMSFEGDESVDSKHISIKGSNHEGRILPLHKRLLPALIYAVQSLDSSPLDATTNQPKASSQNDSIKAFSLQSEDVPQQGSDLQRAEINDQEEPHSGCRVS